MLFRIPKEQNHYFGMYYDHMPVYPSSKSVKRVNDVKHMSIAMQRLGKNIPEFKLSTIGHPLLSNGPIKKHS